MIAVIGGGAAGLMSAILLAQKGQQVTIFERLDRVGKKILATGNGRCNLTNTQFDISHYYGDTAFAQSVFDKYGVADAIRFFESIGIVCKTMSDGRVYPASLQASSVLDALRYAAGRLGVVERCGFMVKQIQPTKKGFMLIGPETVKASAVIVACGGAAAPQLGTDGNGYQLLTQLGHRLAAPTPVLVQVKSTSPYPKQLNGIKIEARCTAYLENKKIKTDEGEILFTNYGLSGPPIFQLARYVSAKTEFSLDLLPGYSFQELVTLLGDRRQLLAAAPPELFFNGLLHKQVGKAVLRALGVPVKTVGDLTDKNLKALAALLKDWRFAAAETTGFANAQATHGGILTEDFTPQLESKLHPGLFAAGELLNVDGDCGGYNLQWAWSSAMAIGGAYA